MSRKELIDEMSKDHHMAEWIGMFALIIAVIGIALVVIYTKKELGAAYFSRLDATRRPAHICSDTIIDDAGPTLGELVERIEALEKKLK